MRVQRKIYAAGFKGRYVVAWRLSNTLDGSFCLERLDEALAQGRPAVFNTDQGVQFTAEAFTGRLESAVVAVSRDGRGRALDNVFVVRLRRAVKANLLRVRILATVAERVAALRDFRRRYNQQWPIERHGFRSPARAWADSSRCFGELAVRPPCRKVV